MTAISGGNALDILKGPYVQLDLATYVTAGGAGTFNVPLGFLRDVEVDETHESTDEFADNCTAPIDTVEGKTVFKVKFTLVEASLRKKEIAAGGLPANVLVASGTATRPLNEISTTTFWQMKVTNLGLGMKPGHTEFATDLYIKRTAVYWRAKLRLGGGEQHKGLIVRKCEATIYVDTSVTTSTTKGSLGYEADTTT